MLVQQHDPPPHHNDVTSFQTRLGTQSATSSHLLLQNTPDPVFIPSLPPTFENLKSEEYEKVWNVCLICSSVWPENRVPSWCVQSQMEHILNSHYGTKTLSKVCSLIAKLRFFNPLSFCEWISETAQIMSSVCIIRIFTMNTYKIIKKTAQFSDLRIWMVSSLVLGSESGYPNTLFNGFPEIPSRRCWNSISLQHNCFLPHPYPSDMPHSSDRVIKWKKQRQRHQLLT
jgi:hypothetical protein